MQGPAPTWKPAMPCGHAASSSRGRHATVIAASVVGATASVGIRRERSRMSRAALGQGSAWESRALEPHHSAAGGRHGRGSRFHHPASPALTPLHPLRRHRSRGRCSRKPRSRLALRLGLQLVRQPPTWTPDRAALLRLGESNPAADHDFDQFRDPSCRQGMGHRDFPPRC